MVSRSRDAQAKSKESSSWTVVWQLIKTLSHLEWEDAGWE